jgi:hypothetical protein
VLQALVDDQHVEVQGRSAPHGFLDDRTWIRVEESQLRGLDVEVIRERERASFWRNLLWRDVEVGDARFDSDWFLRASREADAQIVLDNTSRHLIQAVPPALPRPGDQEGRPTLLFEKGYAASGVPRYMPRFYDFEVSGGQVSATSIGLDSSAKRLAAAIVAVVGLSKIYERRMAEWEQLAKDLDGRLETRAGWRIDKGTRLIFPLQGIQVSICQSVEKGRLYSRVSCPAVPGHRALQTPITPNQQRSNDQYGKRVEAALRAARPTRVFQDTDTIRADLAGCVTELPRLMAAAGAITTLALSGGKQVPYR